MLKIVEDIDRIGHDGATASSKVDETSKTESNGVQSADSSGVSQPESHDSADSAYTTFGRKPHDLPLFDSAKDDVDNLDDVSRTRSRGIFV